MSRVHEKTASHGHSHSHAHNGGNDHAITGSVQELKDGVVQLRDDLSTLAGTVVDAGKSGVEAVKQTAADAVEGVKSGLNSLKDQGTQSVQAVGQKMGDHPLATTLIAFAAGFLAAKFMSRK
jgi:ElaB/YqjD/DUF883 family membrane-anchored ribosome-binding protein